MSRPDRSVLSTAATTTLRQNPEFPKKKSLSVRLVYPIMADPSNSIMSNTRTISDQNKSYLLIVVVPVNGGL